MDGIWIDLAVEMTSPEQSMAWRCGDGRVGERKLGSGRRHETALVRAMDDLFGELGLEPSRLRQMFMSRGPGSFTGTRVALAVAHMAALAGGVRVIGVATDEVIAEGFSGATGAPPGRFVIVLNSKKGGGYLSRWEPAAQGGWERVWAGAVDDIGGWLEQLAPVEGGSTVVLSQVDIAVPLPAGVEVMVGEPAFPRASCLLAVGTRHAASPSPPDGERLPLPLYGRQPEAVTLWEKRRVNEKE